MNNRLLVPQKLPLLLDYAPGAAAAYSLRSLSNSYTGPVVTVRRSTDSAELDFTAPEVSDGTLAAWCGGGDGFVKVWHDQSLNNRDCTQATTADQPKIVESGSLILSGNAPAVRFATVNDLSTFRLQTAAFSPAIPQPFSVFLVFNRTLDDDRQAVFASRTSNVAFGLEANTGVYTMNAGLSLLYGIKQTGLQSHFGFFSSSASSAYIDGALSVSGNAGSNSLDGVTLGNLGGVPSVVANGYSLIGTISEVIIYPTDMTALRDRITADQMWYY